MRIYHHNNSLKVDECRVLGGIDTLYFFINNETELYQNLWLKASKQEVINPFENLGYSGKNKGFVGSWYRRYHESYRVPLYRVGFKDPKKQKNINNIYIQLEASGIYSLGFFELLELIKKDLYSLLDVKYNLDDFVVSRLDINAFCGGFDFGSLSTGMFLTRAKQEVSIEAKEAHYIDDEEFTYTQNRRLQTLYIGSKSSPISLKIYNKNEELEQQGYSTSKFVKLAYLSHNGFFEDTWNIEFSLKRVALKQYKLYTVGDVLKSCNTLWRDLMKKYVFVGFDKKHIDKLRNSKNQKRLKAHDIWKKLTDDYSFIGNEVVERSKTAPRKASKKYFLEDMRRKLEVLKDLNVSISEDDIKSLIA